MKLYGIRDKLYSYRVDEFEVEKETEKQYVIIRDYNKFFNDKFTIRKKDMSNYMYIKFTLTKEEALETQKFFIRNEIKSNKARIENIEDRNVYLNNLLDAMED